jgi:hypothetical protein
VSIVTTLLAFVVIVPFMVGAFFFKRLSLPYKSIFYLCGLWVMAEVYSYVLRINGIENAHVSYVLTALEIFLFASFYANASPRHYTTRFIKRVSLSGFLLVGIDYIIFSTPLNTFSLSIEYFILTGFALYLFYEITTNKSSESYTLINFTLLFYTLSSFPYFFAWEWLRISDMELLLTLSYIHSFVHAICYFIMAYILWRSSLLYSVR